LPLLQQLCPSLAGAVSFAPETVQAEVNAPDGLFNLLPSIPQCGGNIHRFDEAGA